MPSVERAPLTGTYRGYDIITAPPPSSGGVGILQMLGVLEGSGYEKSGAGSAAELHYLAETMRRYFADRAVSMGDPDFVKVPLAGLLDPAYIAQLRKSIDPEHATPSAQIRAGASAPGPESTETTHYSIVDAEGNAVAVTYTLNGGYGNGVTVPGLGFPAQQRDGRFRRQARRAEWFRPGAGRSQRDPAPQTAALVDDSDHRDARTGKLIWCWARPADPRIINSVLQVLVNVVDFGMNVQDAVDFPRIHHQWMPDQLVMERGFSPDTIALLKARGHQVTNGGRHRRSGRDSGARRVAARRGRSAHRGHRQRILSMQRVLSTHLFVNHRLTVAQLDKIQHAGIPAVEIFCARQHLDYRDRAQITELGYWFRDSELKLHSLHSPDVQRRISGAAPGRTSVINITEPVKIKRLEMVDEIKRALEIAETIPFST